jgi:hypothetical protein
MYIDDLGDDDVVVALLGMQVTLHSTEARAASRIGAPVEPL